MTNHFFLARKGDLVIFKGWCVERNIRFREKVGEVIRLNIAWTISVIRGEFFCPGDVALARESSDKT